MRLKLNRLILPWIAGVLLLYVAAHSPLRDTIASIAGMDSRGCFFCELDLTGQGFFNGLAALVLILASGFGAWVLASRFDGTISDRALVFGLSGLGFIAVPSAWMGEAADLLHLGLLRPPWGPLMAALPAVVVAIVALNRGWRPQKISLLLEKPGNLTLWIAGLGLLMAATSAAVSLLHPPSGYDALGYHGPVSIFIWQDGSLGAFLDRNPGIWALAHPGTIEIWTGLIRLVGGDSLANLGQLPFLLLGCISVYAFGRRMGLRQSAAQLAAACFLLVPMAVLQVGMQLNDLAAAMILMAAVALASAPVSAWKTDRLLFIGVELGLASTAKLALLPGVFAVGLIVVGGLVWRSRRKIESKTVVFHLTALALAFLLVVLPWWLRNVVRFGNPVFPAALPFLEQGFFFSQFNKADLAFVPRAFAWPMYPFLEIHDELSGLGTLFAVCWLPGFLLAIRRSQRQPLVLYCVTTVVMLAGWWFLSERFPRFLLAPAGLSLVFVPWALLAIPHPFRRAGYLLVGIAALFSTWVTFQQGLLPFGRQPIVRPDFYDQVWGLDPVVLALPETERVFWQTGFAPTLPEYAANLPLMGVSHSRRVSFGDQDLTAETVIARMHREEIRYAYVTADPEYVSQVMAVYPAADFELVHQSQVIKGERTGPRRNLFRSAGAGENSSTRRYLFRLLR